MATWMMLFLFLRRVLKYCFDRGVLAGTPKKHGAQHSYDGEIRSIPVA